MVVGFFGKSRFTGSKVSLCGRMDSWFYDERGTPGWSAPFVFVLLWMLEAECHLVVRDLFGTLFLTQ